VGTVQSRAYFRRPLLSGVRRLEEIRFHSRHLVVKVGLPATGKPKRLRVGMQAFLHFPERASPPRAMTTSVITQGSGMCTGANERAGLSPLLMLTIGNTQAEI
jgi:hypothetical protein